MATRTDFRMIMIESPVMCHYSTLGTRSQLMYGGTRALGREVQTLQIHPHNSRFGALTHAVFRERNELRTVAIPAGTEYPQLVSVPILQP